MFPLMFTIAFFYLEVEEEETASILHGDHVTLFH